MKANELRIGNLFQDELTGSLLIVWQLVASGQIVFDVLNRDKFLPEGWQAKPIPLTEEWLKKFGFDVVHQKNKHYQIQDPNGIRQCFKIHVFPTVNEQWHIAFSDKSTGKEVDYIPTTAIKHVHQLQNLYFALTREELTIKE